MFEYEHSSKFNVSADTREQLVKEIEEDEFHLSPLQGKIILNDIEKILKERKIRDIDEFEKEFMKYSCIIPEEQIKEMFRGINEFIHTEPKIPVADKRYIPTVMPEISVNDDREKIMGTITSLKDQSELAMLTLYVYRQMDQIDWLPFIKASIERNPVCFADLNKKSVEDVYEIL